MTREEAIIRLMVLSVEFNEYKPDEEAFEMAIKALEQESILDKVEAEIEQIPSEWTTDGRRMIRRGSVFRIINKYKQKIKE